MIVIIKSIWADPRVQTAFKAFVAVLTGVVAERIVGIIDALGGVAPVV